jgi:hypothetical protein
MAPDQARHPAAHPGVSTFSPTSSTSIFSAPILLASDPCATGQFLSEPRLARGMETIYQHFERTPAQTPESGFA